MVAERLGHSRVGITLDRYNHVTDDLQEEAALALDRALGRGPRAVAVHPHRAKAPDPGATAA